MIDAFARKENDVIKFVHENNKWVMFGQPVIIEVVSGQDLKITLSDGVVLYKKCSTLQLLVLQIEQSKEVLGLLKDTEYANDTF